MISDESSSDSETGRFKCRTKTEDENKKNSQKDVSFRSLGRNRPSGGDRFRRGFDSKRDERDRHERRSRERHGYGRHSPVRRRHSRERSPRKRSHERERERDRPPRHHGESRPKSRPRDSSKDRRNSKSRSHRTPEHKKDLKEELRRHIKEEVKPQEFKRDLKEELKRHLKEEVKSQEHKRDLKEELKRHIKEEVRPQEHKRDLKEELKRHIKEEVRPQEHKRDLKEELKRHIKEEVRPQDHKRDLKEELKRHIKEEIKPQEHKRDFKGESDRHPKDEVKPAISKEKRIEKFNRRSSGSSSSPEYKGKRSVVHKPTTSQRKRSRSPIVGADHNSGSSEEVQLGSYYSMIPVVKDKVEETPKPTIVKEKSDESSEIDSSDDERLRAKLLNLEKELHKTRKKKHKKKHKRKSSKSLKDPEQEPSAVEVSSTTDIDKIDLSHPQTDTVEVTSTQKSKEKESSEEGEINSDEDSQKGFEIDPTDLRHKLKRTKTKTGDERVSSNRDICGPALPPHLQNRYDRSKSRETEGPALPAHLKSKPKNIGPSIPDDLRKVLAEREHEDVKYVSSDEDVGIGPLPAGTEDKWSDAHKRLEERALDMKIKKLDGRSIQKSDVKSREEWMLELPEGKAKYLGLEARSFRAKAGPDMSDRSSWTDTPEEKARKAVGLEKEEDVQVTLQREARARHIASRDLEQELAVKKHKKKHKRDESLLEMHEKKLKKKKKKDEKEGKAERRPFSRDVDLQVNRFDEAQKASIIKKAQTLDSRFGRGEAKYL